MKNRKSMSKLTAIVLLITMLTLIAIVGTYAKYTSNFNGTGKVGAADWNVTLSGDGSTYNQTFELTSEEKIYPGAEGKLGTITVKNNSSLVKAKIVNVEISEIKVDGEVNPITNLVIVKPDVSTQETIEPQGTSTLDVKYKWTYDDTDETKYAEKPVTFKVTVTVDQVV